MKHVVTLMSMSLVCWLVAGARGDDPVKMPLDNEFLIKAATCNHAVIAISKMAEAQGEPDVKAFASLLVKDHQASYEKLAELLKTSQDWCRFFRHRVRNEGGDQTSGRA